MYNTFSMAATFLGIALISSNTAKASMHNTEWCMSMFSKSELRNGTEQQHCCLSALYIQTVTMGNIVYHSPRMSHSSLRSEAKSSSLFCLSKVCLPHPLCFQHQPATHHSCSPNCFIHKTLSAWQVHHTQTILQQAWLHVTSCRMHM